MRQMYGVQFQSQVWCTILVRGNMNETNVWCTLSVTGIMNETNDLQ